MEIREIRRDKKAYLALLLRGDEQESMIDRYLDEGDMYVGFLGRTPAAVIVVRPCEDGALEICNLAVEAAYERRSFGRAMIEFIAETYRRQTHVLRLGTGESPATLPFYEKCGFSVAGRICDYFIEHYDHPIVEGGVMLRDMVIMEKRI